MLPPVPISSLHCFCVISVSLFVLGTKCYWDRHRVHELAASVTNIVGQVDYCTPQLQPFSCVGGWWGPHFGSHLSGAGGSFRSAAQLTTLLECHEPHWSISPRGSTLPSRESNFGCCHLSTLLFASSCDTLIHFNVHEFILYLHAFILYLHAFIIYLHPFILYLHAFILYLHAFILY